MKTPSFLKSQRDYTEWIVYKKSVVVCDVTEMFIRKHFPYKSRTIDQMRQAARSCKQNIVEGVVDGVTSIETCIKLLGVAKGSLRELLEDYKDYLRQNKLELWGRNDQRTVTTRLFCRSNNDPAMFVEKCEQRSAETVANIAIILIRQLDVLLNYALKSVEEDFIKNGGIRERMTKVRLEYRKRNGLPEKDDE